MIDSKFIYKSVFIVYAIMLDFSTMICYDI